MFTTEHFIWLGISLVIILGMLFIQKRFKLSLNTVLTIMISISMLSETTKILCNMQPAPDGRTGLVLDPGDLPFHLCSIQIFLLMILKFLVKSEETKEKFLAFMCPTMILGAVIALFVPTVGVGFDVVQVYQYFIYHCFLIFFAIYILRERLVHWTWKRYPFNLACIGLLAMLAMWINSALIDVLPRANFMYLVRPPMDNLPILTIENGWTAYFLTLAGLVIGLMGIFHLLVTLLSNKKKETELTAVTKKEYIAVSGK